jgi:serine/threonine protein phosphatase 1
VFLAYPPLGGIKTLGRTIAIGDIHGCSKALRAIIDAIKPNSDDTLVTLGDYIDRGPDSKGVVDQLVDLQQSCNLIPLRGNHELMLSGVCLMNMPANHWVNCGGQSTIASYGGRLDRIPTPHLDFFRSLRPFYETERAIFVHAGYDPWQEMPDQTEHMLYWEHLPQLPLPPHQSGKTAYVGHTPQGTGRPLDWGHLVCLDTYCFGGLWLTALDVDSREMWQASYHGHLRRLPLHRIIDWCRRVLPGRPRENPSE